MSLSPVWNEKLNPGTERVAHLYLVPIDDIKQRGGSDNKSSIPGTGLWIFHFIISMDRASSFVYSTPFFYWFI